MKYCASCGTPHEPHARFCAGCGTSLRPAPDVRDSGVPATEETTGPATTTSASSSDPEPGPARAVLHEQGDETGPASEPTLAIPADSDSVLATSPAASGAVSIEPPPARGAPSGTGQQTWEQPQPPQAPTLTERWVPHTQSNLETQSLGGGGLSVPPRASGDAPVGRPERSRRLLLIASVVMAVLIIAVAAVGIRHMTSASSVSRAVGSTAAPTSSPSTLASKPAATTSPTKQVPIAPTPDPQVVAIAALQANRADDLHSIPLTGQWIAQLASKTPGIVDPNQITAQGGHTFSAADILSEFLKARNNPNYGSYVGLLLSTDYGTPQLYKGQALWVTFAAVPGFSSADDVRTWCAQQFPTLTGTVLDDSCTPRTLDPLG